MQPCGLMHNNHDEVKIKLVRENFTILQWLQNQKEQVQVKTQGYPRFNRRAKLTVIYL